MVVGLIQELLRTGQEIRQVDSGIYSVLPGGSGDNAIYDSGSRLYDLVVGNPAYLRLVWGNRRAEFSSFAAEAIRAGGDGPFLDAGCGSLLFTADLYSSQLTRPALLVDKSIGMLRAARDRLVRRHGYMPDNITLLQADLLDLPFRPGAFSSVMCMGLLHIFPDPARLVTSLRLQLAPGAELRVSSLMLSGRALGDRYLGLLHRSGQVAEPRSRGRIIAALRPVGGKLLVASRGATLFMVSH